MLKIQVLYNQCKNQNFAVSTKNSNNYITLSFINFSNSALYL